MNPSAGTAETRPAHNPTHSVREGSTGSGSEPTLARTVGMDDKFFLRRQQPGNATKKTPSAVNGRGKDNGYAHRRTASIPVDSPAPFGNGNETRRKKAFVDTPAIIARHLSRDNPDCNDSHYRILMELAEVVKSSTLKSNCLIGKRDNSESSTDAMGDVQGLTKLCSSFKRIGKVLEEKYADKVDGLFYKMRNLVKQDTVDPHIRYKFLELIELRASHWVTPARDNFHNAKKFDPNLKNHDHNNDQSSSDRSSSIDNDNEKKFRNLPNATRNRSVTFAANPDESALPENGQSAAKREMGNGDGDRNDLQANPDSTPGSLPAVNKYALKDQIFIKASDAGRVMGVKGKHIHQIEEISNTIISFQKDFQNNEREVTICGPEENAIKNAKLLIRETIRRNCSPTREFLNGSSDTNSCDSSLPNGHPNGNKGPGRRDCCCRWDRCSSCGSNCCEDPADLGYDFYRGNNPNPYRCLDCSDHHQGAGPPRRKPPGHAPCQTGIFGARPSNSDARRFMPPQYYNVVQYYKKEGVGPLLDPPGNVAPNNMAAVLYSSKKYALDDSLLDLRSVGRADEQPPPNDRYHRNRYHGNQHYHPNQHHHNNHHYGNDRYHGPHHHHYHGNSNAPSHRNRFGSDSTGQCSQCRPGQVDPLATNGHGSRSGHYIYYQSPAAGEDDDDMHPSTKSRSFVGGKRNSFGPVNPNSIAMAAAMKNLNGGGRIVPRLQRTKSFTSSLTPNSNEPLKSNDEMIVSSTTKIGGTAAPKCSLQIGETTLTLQGKQSDILEVAKNVLERYFEVTKDGKEAGDVNMGNGEKWNGDAISTCDDGMSKAFRSINFAGDKDGDHRNFVQQEVYNGNRYKPLLKRSYSFHHAHPRDNKGTTGRKLFNETEYPATMLIGARQQQHVFYLHDDFAGDAGKKLPTEIIPPIKKYQVGFSKDPHVKPIPKDVTRVAYTRDFMIKCAFSPFSRVTPKDLPRISRLAPFLIRHTPQDPTFYLRPKAMLSANASSKLSPTGVHGMIPIAPPTLVRPPSSNNPMVNPGIVYQLEQHFNPPPFSLNILPGANGPRASPSLLGVAPYPPPPPQIGSVGPPPPFLRGASGVGTPAGGAGPYFI